MDTSGIAVAQPWVVTVAEAPGHGARGIFLRLVVVGGLVAVLRDGNSDVLRFVLGEADNEVGLAHLVGKVIQRGNLQHGGANTAVRIDVSRLMILTPVPLDGGRPFGVGVCVEFKLRDAARW